MTREDKVKEHQRQIVEACQAAVTAELEKTPDHNPVGPFLFGLRNVLAKEIAELRVRVEELESQLAEQASQATE